MNLRKAASLAMGLFLLLMLFLGTTQAVFLKTMDFSGIAYADDSGESLQLDDSEAGEEGGNGEGGELGSAGPGAAETEPLQGETSEKAAPGGAESPETATEDAPQQVIKITIEEDENGSTALYLVPGEYEEETYLAGVTAVDENGESVPVSVQDLGGIHFDTPGSGEAFLITYQAVHPVTGEVFAAVREAYVTLGLLDIMPLSMAVANFAQLEAAILAQETDIEIIAPIVFTKALTITAQNTTIRAGADTVLTAASSRHFTHAYAGGAATLTFSNITLSGGGTGGGIVNQSPDLTLRGVSIQDCRNTTNGGGVLSSGSLTLVNATIQGCSATSGGGGVFADSTATLTVDSCTLSGNSAVSGGGIYGKTISIVNSDISGNNAVGAYTYGGGISGAAGSNITILRSTIDNNTTYCLGGGIWAGVGSTITLISGSVSGNQTSSSSSADGRGGGILAESNSTININGGSIDNNYARAQGGGVYANANCTVIMSGAAGSAASISGNQATSGGALFLNTGATLQMSGGTMSGNQVVSSGGAIYAYDTGVAINMSGGSIVNNTAGSGGGGICYYVSGGSSTLAMTGGVISNNRAAFGGAISDHSANPATANLSIAISGTSAITGNHADGNGGAICCQTAGTVVHIDSAAKITGNEAGLDGGGIWVDQARLSNISVRNGATFSANTAQSAHWMTDATDIATHAAKIGDSVPLSAAPAGNGRFRYAYNNYDIAYTGGNTSYAITYLSVTYYDGGVVKYKNITLEPGMSYTIVSSTTAGLSKAGYVFVGWNTMADGSGIRYPVGSQIVLLDNMQLYAQWGQLAGGGPSGGGSSSSSDGGSAPTYTVVYDPNGGTGGRTDSVYLGQSYTVLSKNAAQVSRSGYSFVGWNTRPDGKGVAYKPGAVIVIAGNMVLYAQWTDIPQTGDDGAGEMAAAYAPTMDFQTLLAEAPDVKAWIRLADTVIDYPVVQGEDNAFYLNHLPNGIEDKRGAIFMDSRIPNDFSGDHTLLYGHHSRDGSMFAALMQYKDRAFFESHPYFMLYTPENDYIVEVLGAYILDATQESFPLCFADITEAGNYVEMVKKRSAVAVDAEIEAGDRLVTLCTCTYEYSNARLAVVGRLVEVIRLEPNQEI